MIAKLFAGAVVAAVALLSTIAWSGASSTPANDLATEQVASTADGSCCPDGACCPDGDCCATAKTIADGSCCPLGICCPGGPCCAAVAKAKAKAATCCPDGSCCPDGACCQGASCCVAAK
ncbi:MAG TPA: hypothetical protein VKE94_00560 [Gemmataceae bacterium]|nr:hypothetical protein [Gemmataceae bacterium]